MKTFDQELVSGSVLRSVWKLGWPIVLMQLVSGIHGFVDQVLVGHSVGYEANAGIGVAWQLFLVIVVFVSSLFHGMGILIARYTGRQDYDAIGRVAYDTLLTSLYVLVLIVAPVGYFLSPYMLDWANTSPEVKVHALPYLRILFTGSFPLFLMFMLNGAFMSSGDPRTPMWFAFLTTAVNVVISYVLITGLGPLPALGAIGAAIGTCVGPIPSVVIALWLIVKRKTVIVPPKKLRLLPDFSVMKVVARIGVPAGLQAVLLNLGGAILLAFIGSLEQSAAAQAAYTICYGQLFSFVTWTGFGLRAACATVMGQNIGAGKPERGKAAVNVAAGLGFIWALLLGLLYWNMPAFLLGMFDATEPEVLRIGTTLLRYLTFSGLFVVVTLAFTGGMQGAGDTKTPMFIAFATQIVVLLGICYAFMLRGTLTTNVIWTAILLSHLSRLVLTYAMFYRGKWEDIRVEIDV